MSSIEIDFDVYKALTARRTSEAVSYNDVLREVLGLGTKPNAPTPAPVESGKGDWVSKGVRFPAGTEFRAQYKGQQILGRVENGALSLNGKTYDSPSAAAVSVTGNAVNGWNFWECRFPGTSPWVLITSLRR